LNNFLQVEQNNRGLLLVLFLTETIKFFIILFARREVLFSTADIILIAYERG
jgi:hypothetical protein